MAEHGLHVLALRADRRHDDTVFARIGGTAGDGLRDRLTGCSRPASGALAPSLTTVIEVAALEDD